MFTYVQHLIINKYTFKIKQNVQKETQKETQKK
jgi:hypothetical protein